jgi:hypothetical protein
MRGEILSGGLSGASTGQTIPERHFMTTPGEQP